MRRAGHIAYVCGSWLLEGKQGCNTVKYSFLCVTSFMAPSSSSHGAALDGAKFVQARAGIGRQTMPPLFYAGNKRKQPIRTSKMRLFFICFFFFNPASAYFLNEEECLNYTVYPVQYELTVFPQVLTKEDSYYDCDLTITVIANAPNVRRIELDAKDLEFDRDSVRVLNGNGLDIVNSVRPYEYDRRAGKIYLYLKEELELYNLRNMKYHIKASFRKFLKREQSGVFVTSYEENGHKKYVLF